MNQRAEHHGIPAEARVALALAHDGLAVAHAPARAQSNADANGTFRFVCLEDRVDLAGHVAAWDDLALHAMEPNIFCESWLLQPALESYAQDARLRLVLAYLDRPGTTPLLCGFFPFEHAGRLKGLPANHLRLWRPKHSYLATPLLRPVRAHDCLKGLLKWLASDSRGAGIVDWALVRGDGPFFQVLLDVLSAGMHSVHVMDFHSRALLRKRSSLEDYLAQAISHKARKDMRRRTRRLREQGTLEYVALESRDKVAAWTEEFLDLEASGWKGRRGSALGSTVEGRRFFTDIVAGAEGRGQLAMMGVSFRGRMIAMQCSFLSGEGAFAFKIAYDESFARYSPGLLLELEHLERFHDGERGPVWMDSCAAPVHFMADRIWLDRRSIVSLVSSTGGGPGNFLVSSLPLLRWGYRLVRTKP